MHAMRAAPMLLDVSAVPRWHRASQSRQTLPIAGYSMPSEVAKFQILRHFARGFERDEYRALDATGKIPGSWPLFEVMDARSNRS
jgi:hypothetical protein